MALGRCRRHSPASNGAPLWRARVVHLGLLFGSMLRLQLQKCERNSGREDGHYLLWWESHGQAHTHSAQGLLLANWGGHFWRHWGCIFWVRRVRNAAPFWGSDSAPQMGTIFWPLIIICNKTEKRVPILGAGIWPPKRGRFSSPIFKK